MTPLQDANDPAVRQAGGQTTHDQFAAESSPHRIDHHGIAFDPRTRLALNVVVERFLQRVEGNGWLPSRSGRGRSTTAMTGRSIARFRGSIGRTLRIAAPLGSSIGSASHA